MVVRPRRGWNVLQLLRSREVPHHRPGYDSRTSSFALGTKYTVWEFILRPDSTSTGFRLKTPKGSRTTHLARDIAGLRFLSRRINVGVTARVLRQEYELRDPVTKFTMDAGVSFFPHPRFGFGFSAQNFIPTENGRYPTRLSPGLGLLIDDFLQFEADAVFTLVENQEKPDADLHIGGEITLFRAVSIRAGYYSERQFTENYGWGLGLGVERARQIHYDANRGR